jgi:chromosome segregation ATPase
MRNALHELRHKSVVGRRVGLLPILIVGILAAYAIVNAAAVPSAQTAQEQPQPLEQRAREAEAALQQHSGTQDDQAQVLLADIEALHARIQTIRQELDGLTTVGPTPGAAPQPTGSTQELRHIDERIQQLTQQRTELAQTAQQLETQLKQLPLSQEAGRRWLQGEVSRVQGQLHNLDEQLAELRRQRVRADYAATLQSQQQARPGQEQTSPPAAPAPQAMQQTADLSAQLKQLQELTLRNQRELEQLQDKGGPRARELEASLEGIRRQVQTIEERLRTMERTQAMEKLQAADRQRQILESRVQDLGRRQEELNKSVEKIGQDLRSMQDQMRQTQQARAAGEESARRIAQQGAEQLRAESLRQQEELRNEMRSLEERLKAATERTGTGTETFRKEFDSLRADLQRMSQTIGRLERERLDTQAVLQSRVRQLETQVSELRKDLALVQGTLNMMLSQMGRSTVGSAGYPWGW